MFRLVVGIVMFLVVVRLGLFVLRALANPLPPPPESGQMRRVNLRYRCTVCGMELKVTAASDEDPPAPRHCLDEMQLVAPVE